MPVRTWRSVFGILRILLAASLLGCGDALLDPLPLEVTISASPLTPAAGATVTFVVNAQGGNLVGVEIDYGDGGTALRPTGGARTARLTFTHAYATAGTYQVSAVVTDAFVGEAEAVAEVRVQ